MTTQQEALAKEFNGEVLQFQGRGGKTFDYIEDETVMDRLDEVLGIGNWSIRVEPISVAEGIVKVTLEATTENGHTVFEDFGYQSNSGGEGLKEAVSDGIRRCGRYLGIGRYLYRKHTDSPSGTGRAGSPSSPARPAAAPRPTIVADDPYADLPPPWEREDFKNEDTCPDHELAWVLKPGGTSKTTGKPYDAFWACPSDERPFCKNKPSRAWQARHEG
jgi:hypothetical protein